MKGTIDLHEEWGWGVINHTDESIPDWIPLHPDDLTYFAEMKEKFDNFEARVLSSPEVEFETIIHPKFTGRIIYAKLNTKEEPTISEEAKQRAANYMSLKGALDSQYVDFSNPNADKITSASTTTIKAEPTMIDDWLNEYGDPEIYKKVEKQLELEEAAERYSLELLEAKTIQHHEKTWIKSMFIHIAKWQQKRMYSEEEVQVKLYECLGHFAQKHNIIIEGSEIDQWFEQFKKK